MKNDLISKTKKNLVKSIKITRYNLDYFIKKHATEKRTLNIGSGTSPYIDHFPNSVNLDIEKSGFVDILGDAQNLPFKDKTFEVILATEILEHLKEPQKAIDEMKRVCKNNGKLILTTRFIFPLHDTPNDYYRYTKYGLRHLLREWRIIEIKEETDTVGSIAVLLQRIGFQCDILYFKPFKLFFHFIAHIIKHFGFIITKEYGTLSRSHMEKNIMSSGYYVLAIKLNTNHGKI